MRTVFYDVAVLALFVGLADVILIAYLVRIWRRVHREYPGFRLNFRIVDVWAATLGLSPSLAYLSMLLQGSPR